jgi:hypothetical protein
VSKQEAQPYDEALKSLLGDEVVEILPNLLPESEYLGEKNIEEMKQHYAPKPLGEHLARFQKILWRSTTLSEEDKQMVDKKLHTYDSLMDDSPVALRNQVKGAQKMVITFVEARFPSLVELAQQRVAAVGSLEMLPQLAHQVASAPDEATLRWLLDTYNHAA